MTPLHAVVVCVCAAVADVIWARWLLATAAHQPVASASWAAAIFLFGAVSVDALIASRWYVVPAAVGGWFGTFVTVRRECAR